MTTEITVLGAGAVSSLGIGVEALVDGCSQRPPAGPGIADFEIRDYVPIKTQCLDPASRAAIVAAGLALKGAGIEQGPVGREGIGLALGTAHGNAHVLADYAERPEGRGPLRFIHSFINTPAGLTCQVLNLHGPHTLLCSGAGAAIQAIRYATWMLGDGKATVMLCGGVDCFGRDGRDTAHGAGLLALAIGTGVAGAIRLTLGTAPQGTADGLKQACAEAARRAGCGIRDIDAIVPGTQPGGPEARHERAALDALGLDAARRIGFPADLRASGAAHAALAAVLAYARTRMHGAPGFRAAMTAVGKGSASCLVFERTR